MKHLTRLRTMASRSVSRSLPRKSDKTVPQPLRRWLTSASGFSGEAGEISSKCCRVSKKSWRCFKGYNVLGIHRYHLSYYKLAIRLKWPRLWRLMWQWEIIWLRSRRSKIIKQSNSLLLNFRKQSVWKLQIKLSKLLSKINMHCQKQS